MLTQLCYTNDGRLEHLMKEKKIIPHKIIHGEKLIKGETYYDGFYSKLFKVISVEYNKDEFFVGAYIKMEDNNYAWISSELDILQDYFVTYDIYNIRDIEIINNKHIYSGAEIRYWFLVKGINVMNRKYSCFWPYIDPTNSKSIDDNFTYIISANIDEYGNYYSPRIIRIINIENRNNVKAKEYWEKLELRDKQNTNKKRRKKSPRG